MRCQRRLAASAFTLVELLVVIAIVVSLIAMLLPVITRVRRQALVLASPIAYISTTDGQVHLTNPNGTSDVTINLPKTYHGLSDLRWSPSGQTLAVLICNDPFGNHDHCLAVITPMTGVMKVHRNVSEDTFVGLLGDHQFANRPGELHPVIYDTQTGGEIGPLPGSRTERLYSLTAAAAGADGRFVGIGRDFHRSTSFVALVRKDFSRGRTIFAEDYSVGRCVEEDVAMDPTGDWVAWTHRYHSGSWRVAFKHVKEHSSRQPNFLPVPGHAYFCDWTPDGHLMTTVQNTGLFIFDRQGVLRHRVPIHDSVVSGGAGWRKYGHQ